MEKSIYIFTLHIGGGGAERQISLISKFLPIKGIICLENIQKYDVGCPLIILPTPKLFKNQIFNYLMVPYLAYQLAKVLKKDKNVTVLSFLEKPNFINIVSKLFFRHRAIISVRTTLEVSVKKYSKINRFFFNLFIKAIYPNADYIVTNSSGSLTSLNKHYNTNNVSSNVIYNAYDFEKIYKDAKEDIEDFWSNYLTFTNIARFDKEKSHTELIRIFSKVKEVKTNAKLLLFGEGKRHAELVNLGKKLGNRVFENGKDSMSENYDIYFFGFQTNPHRYVSKSDLFLFPTLFEGLPNSLIEALICNTVSLSSDCPSGPREILFPTGEITDVQKEPLLTEYGVLLPPFKGSVNENDKINQVEQFWIDSILKYCDNIAVKKEIKSKLPNRVEEFKFNTIKQKWEKVLFYTVGFAELLEPINEFFL